MKAQPLHVNAASFLGFESGCLPADLAVDGRVMGRLKSCQVRSCKRKPRNFACERPSLNVEMGAVPSYCIQRAKVRGLN